MTLIDLGHHGDSEVQPGLVDFAVNVAAIDNTTRKLLADGKRSISVGFWFALGHSTIVLALGALIAVGAKGCRPCRARTRPPTRCWESSARRCQGCSGT